MGARTVVVRGLLLAACLALPGCRRWVSDDVLQARERWLAGDAAAARTLARAALPRIASEVKARPGDPRRRMALAEALALGGDPRQALAEARSALAAHPAPAASSPGDGRESLIETMAIVAMEAGQAEDALDLVEILLARGSPASAGELATDERFVPLRAHARWQRLIDQYGAWAAADAEVPPPPRLR